MRFSFKSTLGCSGLCLAAVVCFPAAAAAQNAAPAQPTAADTGSVATESDNGSPTGLSDIVVTARKRGVAEAAQSVPVAISAFNQRTLTEMNLKDVRSLTTSAPNVTLESNGVIPGTANFSIRGFGISTSTPSVEPSVGVFVDGVYLGLSAGVVSDLFDTESIEILRGPQGTLFGRNTTGGAISIRTARPTDKFEVKGTAKIESGPLYTLGVSVGGPITSNLKAKLTGYISHDDGWFHNRFDDSKFGKQTTKIGRGVLVWEPSSNLDSTLIVERGVVTGDGTPTTGPDVGQGFELNINNRGYIDEKWTAVTSETNLHVGFGNGIITNILGYRKLHLSDGLDIDGGPTTLYFGEHVNNQHQFSEELRYAGSFGKLQVTTGLYYFHQQFFSIEQRTLVTIPSGPKSTGGEINANNPAIFAQLSYALTPTLSIDLGGRYSWERKRAKTTTFSTLVSVCDYVALTCNWNFPGPTFPGSGTASFHNFTPKIGLNWKPLPGVLLYGSFSQGIRSGGFNVRNTSPVTPPGPYGAERQDAFEIGIKSDWFNHRLRVNAAAFHNVLHNLQRDVLVPDAVLGSVQVTKNVGTARVNGGELEVTALVAKGLTLGATAGYLDGKYTHLDFDLNGALPGFGDNLKLVRLSPWSYSFNASYETRLGNGSRLRGRVDFGHRDRAAANDANTAFLRPINELSSNVGLTLPGEWITFSVYGRNLLNRITNTIVVPQAANLGGGFIGINKGRVVGGAIDFKF